MTRRTRSRQETVAFGRSLAMTLNGGDVVALSGELGTGKTTLVQGICEALGVEAHVASPTFTMISEYRGRNAGIVHIDLYRIRSHQEVKDLGLEEYFSDENICLIEWPELILDLLPTGSIRLRLDYGEAEEERVITIEENVETQLPERPHG